MPEVLELPMVTAGSVKGASLPVHIPEPLRVVDINDKIPDGSKMFRVMTAKDGDKRIVWNSHILQEIAAAKEMFDRLVAQHLVPYRVDQKSGKASTQVMDVFDPTAEEVIFLPVAMVAGG